MQTLNPALKDFWTARARNRVLHGGRMSSKSWDAAGVAVILAQECSIRVLCTRHLQNKIEQSVYTLLKVQIERFGFQDRFRILDNKIICPETGSEFIFYGRWRHIDEIKSLEGIDIHWAEEAHNLTKEQFDIIDPTLRGEESQHWLIFNPQFATDWVYQNFVVNPPPNTIVREINYPENPFLSSTALELIESKKGSDDFDHIYLGVPKDSDDESIIKRSHILAAVGAHKKLGIEPRGSRRKGFDVADSGHDLCATVTAYGPLAVGCDMWKAKEDELMKSCKRVWVEATGDGSLIIYDAIGVGAHCGSKFNELNERHIRVQHAKFFAGGAPFRPDAPYAKTGIRNRDYFANIKAQAWTDVADRFRNTWDAVTNGATYRDDEMIFIDESLPHLTKLIDELSTPKKDFDKAGRVMVETKDDLADRGIDSPNLADAFIMAFCGTFVAPMKINPQALKR